MKRLSLWLLVLVPLLYYFVLVVGALTYPGYSHVTRYASELGAQGAPYPALFNVGIVVAGLAAIAGAYGVTTVLRDISGGRLWPALAGLTLLLWGAAMVAGGMFPMPDERHGAFGLAMAGQLTPLFVLLALRRLDGWRPLKLFLGAVLLVSASLLAVMMGAGGLVTLANVGLWQRAYSASAIPWFAVLGLVLLGWHRASFRSRPVVTEAS